MNEAWCTEARHITLQRNLIQCDLKISEDDQYQYHWGDQQQVHPLITSFDNF